MTIDTAKVAAQIKLEIDQYMQWKSAQEGFRNHLGASSIGRKCKREIWYSFRWCQFVVWPGRMLRLFDRGHREEIRNIEWLRGIGATVWELDPNTGKQIRVYGVLGHFGGSCDGVIQLPERYGVPFPMLLEFKTNKANADFVKLLKGAGMAVVKEDHWAQTCVYGRKLGLEYVCYVNTRKDDDEMHIEVVKLDWKYGDHMETKAELIITSDRPPQRISDNPTNFNCKGCHYNGICHSGDPVEINCRSCRFAKPVEGGEWFCSVNNGIIPKDFIKVGCPQHESVNDVC